MSTPPWTACSGGSFLGATWQGWTFKIAFCTGRFFVGGAPPGLSTSRCVLVLPIWFGTCTRDQSQKYCRSGQVVQAATCEVNVVTFADDLRLINKYDANTTPAEDTTNFGMKL